MTTGRQKIEWGKLLEEALTIKGSIGSIYNRFRQGRDGLGYSFANLVLLRMQGVYEPAGALALWGTFGRTKKQGARPKEIIFPSFRTVTDEEGNKTQVLTGFHPRWCVYAYSDTEGPEPGATPLPGWDRTRALGNLGIRLATFNHQNGNVQGYSEGVEVAVNPLADNPNKDMMNEIGH